MALSDIGRHMASIREQASEKYPEVPLEDMCYVVEYVQTQVTPDIVIQAVPMSGTEWSQHLNPSVVEDHYERVRRGEDSYLILIQSGIKYSAPHTLHYNGNFGNEEKRSDHQLAANLRTVAFNPDGTLLQNSADVIDVLLNAVNSFRVAKDCWTCHLPNEGGIILLDVFGAIDVLCKKSRVCDGLVTFLS